MIVRLSLVAFLICGSPSYSLEIRSHVERHYLNDDGSLNDSSVTPTCYNDSFILFKAYSYQQQRCDFADGCHVEHEEPLSPAAGFLLHKMCSGKSKCENLSFPMRSSEQKQRTNSVYLEYSCLDQSCKIINMCEEGVTHFSDTVYVTTDDTARLFKECQCFVNKDTFSLSVLDLRLTTHGDQCSSATVFVNMNEFACDAQKGDFGSIFRRQMIRSTRNAFISVNLNSKSTIPDEILISITPKVSAKIICEGRMPRSSSTHIAKQQSSTQKIYIDRAVSHPFESVTQHPLTADYSCKVTDKKSHRETCTTCTPLAVGIGIAIVILAIAFVFPEKIQSLKTKIIRQLLDRIRNTYANQTLRSDDEQSSPTGISVHASGSSQRAYPITADTINSVKCDAMMNKSDSGHGKIQSPQDEEKETNFNSLNPQVHAEDQTDAKLCDPDTSHAEDPLLCQNVRKC